jgi:hypothetical protein
LGPRSEKVEHAIDVSILRSQHTDTRVHQRPAIFGRHNQRRNGGLPLRALVFGFRQPRDVIGGVLERDELASARQRDWVFELPVPAAISHCPE